MDRTTSLCLTKRRANRHQSLKSSLVQNKKFCSSQKWKRRFSTLNSNWASYNFALMIIRVSLICVNSLRTTPLNQWFQEWLGPKLEDRRLIKTSQRVLPSKLVWPASSGQIIHLQNRTNKISVRQITKMHSFIRILGVRVLHSKRPQRLLIWEMTRT